MLINCPLLLSADELNISCLSGEGACPPEDGNGLESDRSVIKQTSLKPSEGKVTMLLDSLYVDESGNDLYQFSIEPEGVLGNPRHPEHKQKMQDAIASKNAKFSRPGFFDWRAFSLAEAQTRIREALQTASSCGGGAGNNDCDCNAQEPRRRPAAPKEHKASESCVQCGTTAEATPNKKLMVCGGCKASRYCSPQCQKSHWKQHKAKCSQLKADRMSEKVFI